MELGSSLSGFALLGVCLALFLVAKVVKDLLTPYSIDGELTTHDNLAVAISMSGYLAGTTIVVLGALIGPAKPLLEDIASVGGYGLLGIGLLNVSRYVNDHVILSQFANTKELVKDRNVGTGAVELGSYVASGLIVAGCLHGEGGSILSALALFAAGQVALVVFAKLYNLLLPFSLHDEIEKDNVAAGVSFGGTLIALGVVLLSGTVGNFISWQYNFANFAVHAVAGFILLPIVRILFDRLIIPAHPLNKEIAEDRNVGVGVLESVVVVSAAVFMYFVLDSEALLRGLLEAAQ